MASLMSSLNNQFSRMSMSKTKARVRVRLHSLEGLPRDVCAGQAYMAWLKRNGKARGTKLTWAKTGQVQFDETLSLQVTLYSTPQTGQFQEKWFDLEVIRNETSREAPGQVFGRARLNVAKPVDLVRLNLRTTSTDSAVYIEMTVHVDIETSKRSSRTNKPAAAPATAPSPARQRRDEHMTDAAAEDRPTGDDFARPQSPSMHHRKKAVGVAPPKDQAPGKSEDMLSPPRGHYQGAQEKDAFDLKLQSPASQSDARSIESEDSESGDSGSDSDSESESEDSESDRAPPTPSRPNIPVRSAWS